MKHTDKFCPDREKYEPLDEMFPNEVCRPCKSLAAARADERKTVSQSLIDFMEQGPLAEKEEKALLVAISIVRGLSDKELLSIKRQVEDEQE
jgi:hypothetical protein